MSLSKVLIESDWNLKETNPMMNVEITASINRIRLEFKGNPPASCCSLRSRINRIRLEFKEYRLDAIKKSTFTY